MMKKKKKGAFVIIALLVVLFIANIVIAYPDDFDKGFYLRILSNVLIIISMVISIRYINKQENNKS